jgi:inorganic pyrophosphatase/exopolyphosphatase
MEEKVVAILSDTLLMNMQLCQKQLVTSFPQLKTIHLLLEVEKYFS